MSSVPHGGRVNWRQASAEVALILIGVLVALTVDSWWAEQQGKEKERTYLAAILEDFQDNRRSLLEAIETQKSVIRVGEDILQMLSTHLEGEDTDNFRKRIGDLYYFYDWAPITGTYDDLVGSGNLLIIRNLNLRKELSAFQRILSSIREYEGLQAETYYENQAPFVNKHRGEGTNSFWTSHSSWLDNQQAPAFPYESDLGPFDSPEFWNLVVAWMWVHADVVTAYRQAISACDRIIVLIETELTEEKG